MERAWQMAVALLLVLSTALGVTDSYSKLTTTADEAPNSFEAFKQHFGRTYESAGEEYNRSSIFEANLALIAAHNAGVHCTLHCGNDPCGNDPTLWQDRHRGKWGSPSFPI